MGNLNIYYKNEDGINVYYKNEDGEWIWVAECCNEYVAATTAEYWANANRGELYAWGVSEDNICGEFLC